MELTAPLNEGQPMAVFYLDGTVVNPSRFGMEVRREAIHGKPRRFYRMHGAPDFALGLHENSVHNLERALLERVALFEGAPPPIPPLNYVFHTLRDFKQRLLGHLPSTTHCTREEIVAMYVGRKRDVYQRALESLSFIGVCLDDGRIKAFVKAEKIDFSSKPNACPRIIQPRDPRYNLELGRYLKPYEKKLYRGINRVFGKKTVVKGLNPDEAAAAIKDAWEEFADPVAFMGDAKRWDQHVCMEVLMWEHSVYQDKTPPKDRAELIKLLRMQLINRGRARLPDGWVKYVVAGRRMSGDMNTAMGNVLIMCALVWTYARSIGVKIRLINNGDDCVFIMSRRSAELFAAGLDAWFLRMGFHMDLSDPVDEFEKVQFCQSRPVFDGRKWTLVRCPRPGIGKDMTSLVPWDNESVFKMWMSAVGQGGLALCGGIPIYNALYSRYVEASEGACPLEHLGLESGMMMAAKAMGTQARKAREPCDEARVSFWRAFGISPTEQLAIEQHFRSLPLTWTKANLVQFKPGHPGYLVGCSKLTI